MGSLCCHKVGIYVTTKTVVIFSRIIYIKMNICTGHSLGSMNCVDKHPSIGYNTFKDGPQKYIHITMDRLHVSGPFMIILPYNLYIFLWLEYGCSTKRAFALAISNSVMYMHLFLRNILLASGPPVNSEVTKILPA